MDEDLLQLLIYLALGLVGVIASAYRNRMKRQQTSSRQPATRIPRNLPADPEKDFGPELGPLMELFEIPKPKAQAEVYEYESVEGGPSIEEAGMNLDTQEASAELAGMAMETEGFGTEKLPADEIQSFEEGQSDIQKMIARYEAIRKEISQDDLQDDIAAGEIVSVEAEEMARAARRSDEPFFEARKAIIYSEILKRKEY
jgi:hypothetical protein